MKAQFPFGVASAWPRLTVVFLIDVGVLALARHWPEHWPDTPQTARYAWWGGVGVAALVTLLGVGTFRRVPLASLLVAAVRQPFADVAEALTRGLTPATDHRRRFGRDIVGIREYQGRLVAVIGLQPPVEMAAHRHRADTGATVPVERIAVGLHQFDMRLDEIDIVSASSGAGDHGAGATGTWLVLRMNPQRNVTAVAARDSVAATMAALTERLAQNLDGSHCTAKPLTAEEIADVDAAVTGGLVPADIRPRLRWCRNGTGQVSSFWVSPADISTETLEQLLRTDTEATVTTIRLVAADGETRVSAWVRYHSAERLGKDGYAGLNRLLGRQLAAVRAALPIPSTRPVLVVPSRSLADDDQVAAPVAAAPAVVNPAAEAAPS